MTPQDLEALILTQLPDAQITIRALKDDGRCYQVSVASAAFAGCNTVAQHRIVYQALGTHMHDALHALSLKTTPLQKD